MEDDVDLVALLPFASDNLTSQKSLFLHAIVYLGQLPLGEWFQKRDLFQEAEQLVEILLISFLEYCLVVGFA